ncbi:MAG: cobalt chelatase [Burkholderiales bacterium]
MSSAAPVSAPQAAKHQQQVEELCAAAIRALTGQPDLHFRSRRLHRGLRALPQPAPHLHPSLEHDDFVSFRGAADGVALRLALADAKLHQRLCPADPIERTLFELLEQFRVEALAPDAMRGLRRNLLHRFDQWSMAFIASGLTESARGMLLFTMALMCRARLTGDPVLEEARDLIETTRGMLTRRIALDLAGMRQHLHDQEAFAVHALAIAHTVAELVASRDDERGDDEDASGRDDDGPGFSLLMDFDADVEDAIATPDTGTSRTLEDAAGSYRIFTTAYDREHAAGSLVRVELLREYRERLDAKIAAQGINRTRLTRELRGLLAQPVQEGFDSAQEEGRIDGARLAQLISSPTETRLFKSERHELQADCVVGVLIDCSGSMKQHIEAVAVIVDVLSRSLEQAGVPNEILGYTTGAWNGGRTVRDWKRAGRPKHPGRLNETAHLIFKDADTPWRRARPDIAALFKADLFREGVDGEAVQWAAQRLLAREEARRILIVISDGSPMDSATELANDAFYLDNHLQQVVADLEQQRTVEIVGVGVGLDLSPYYNRCLAIDLSQGLDNALFRDLVALIGGRHRR